MPSSTYKNHGLILEEVMKQQPKSILDVGIGFGKWAFLAREYLETWKNRVFPEQWVVNIEGIEIFKPYVERLPWQKVIYNTIHIGNAFEIIKTLGFYDLIIAGDVVEHLPKEQGISLIKDCIRRSQCAIFSVPIGNWMNNVTVGGNEAESHRAVWNELDFVAIDQEIPGCVLEIHPWQAGNRQGCVAIWKKAK
jgi:hypothetical protein